VPTAREVGMPAPSPPCQDTETSYRWSILRRTSASNPSLRPGRIPSRRYVRTDEATGRGSSGRQHFRRKNTHYNTLRNTPVQVIYAVVQPLRTYMQRPSGAIMFAKKSEDGTANLRPASPNGNPHRADGRRTVNGTAPARRKAPP